MYCKLYIHSDTSEAILKTLETQFGSFEKKMSDYTFKEFEVHISENKESDINKIHIYPDGFLYYKFIVDLDIKSEKPTLIPNSKHTKAKHTITKTLKIVLFLFFFHR